MKRFLSALFALAMLYSGSALALTKNSQGLYVDDQGNVIDEDDVATRNTSPRTHAHLRCVCLTLTLIENDLPSSPPHRTQHSSAFLCWFKPRVA